jgi:cell division protein YceG involved in septum cleavage
MTVKRIIVVALVSIFFASLLIHVGIEISYASNKPQSPQPESGRVVRITINHGSVVYVSNEELERLHSVQTAAVCTMLASFIGIGILKLFRGEIWK